MQRDDVGTLVTATKAVSGTGNSLANEITGGSGNDTLAGGAGVDKLIGGAGDDTYLVDRAASSSTDADGNTLVIAGDQTIELDNGGIDTVRASTTSWTLSANVENLIAMGSDSFRGTGNLLANQIAGNSGNDRLFGMDGNDTLTGGLGDDTLSGGNDRDGLYGSEGSDQLLGGAGDDTLSGGADKDILTGGLGSDYFVFDTAPNGTYDTITDFQSGDRIQLASGTFAGIDLTKTGILANTLVEIMADTRLVYQYDAKTLMGTLSYDDDGSGEHTAIVIAQVKGVAVLAATDFAVL